MNEKIQIVLTGDFMLESNYLNFKKKQGNTIYYPFSNLKKEILENNDIFFTNLECTLSNNGSSMRKNTGPQLYSPPNEIFPLFKYLGVNVISLSNNHINDFSENDLEITKKILEEKNFAVFGAGKNIKEANKEVIIEKNNIKIGFLGYTTNTDKDHISPDIGASIATNINAGCVYYDINQIKEDIQHLKSKTDFVLISLHWGYELFNYPSPKQIELAHNIINAGADIIIGHHPHVIQGIENYNNGIIFYSLGNFFFWNYNNVPQIPNDCNEFLIARCELDTSGSKKFEIFPGYLDNNYKLKLYKNKEKEKTLKRIKKLSDEIKMENYEEFWNNYQTKRKKYLKIIKFRGLLIEFYFKIKKEGLKGILNKNFVKTIKNQILILIQK